MARKRKADEVAEERSPVEEEMAGEAADLAALSWIRRARKRFLGVRQRPSGRWVAEIKDTIQKIRVWLGTYDSAEEAARAYDEAACLLRGANTRTNFWPCSNSASSTPALPSKISNLLLHRLRARNRSLSSSPPSNPSLPITRGQNPTEDESRDDRVDLSDTHFADFLIDPEEEEDCLSYKTNDIVTTPANLETAVQKENSSVSEHDGGDVAESYGFNGEEGEANDVGLVDLQFVDEIGTCEYSPFQIAEDILEPIEHEINGDGEPSLLREAMKRMNYERKFSASLYAFNGIPECLRLKHGMGRAKGDGRSHHFGNVSETNGERNIEGKGVEKKEEGRTPEGEFSWWSSIDLPPICFVI